MCRNRHIALLFLLGGSAAVRAGLAQSPANEAEPEASADAYRIYWGDVHGHTGDSDGKGTVAEYFQYARDRAKLDFVIVTDHDFGNKAPWRMPKERWQSAQARAREFTASGTFVALAGYEWTSQPKYWSGFTNGASEKLFAGPPKYYSHKNVYFFNEVGDLFSAKDIACRTPDLLAAAVSQAGGLIHNSHPTADPDSRGQFDYETRWASVIANTEMLADSVRYKGKTYQLRGEEHVQAYLNRGGRTGFVGGTDTHQGQPAARTAVLAAALTREALFEALRHRRNYAVSRERIVLDFKINGHWMGEEIAAEGPPHIAVSVQGTDRLAAVEVIRKGVVVHRVAPEGKGVRFEWADAAFSGEGWYYVRVTQADADEHGNPSRAWSSPIWVKAIPR